MAREVKLSITGIQKAFGQEDPVTLVTTGKYVHKEGTHYLFYSEFTENKEEVKNRLTITPDHVELKKSGKGVSLLKFDRMHAQPCLYQSVAGPMELVSDTKKIKITHGHTFLKMVLVYSFSMNGQPVSDYHLTMEARWD